MDLMPDAHPVDVAADAIELIGENLGIYILEEICAAMPQALFEAICQEVT